MFKKVEGGIVKIKYNQFLFHLKFKNRFTTKVYPSFVLRSVLGNELRKLSCILRGKECGDCPLKFQCAYSYIFETPINKNTEFLLGRDRASHPFRIFSDTLPRKEFEEIRLTLSLFGRGVDYFPYLFFALKMGGEKGLFKERIPYEIKSIQEGDSVVYNGEGDQIEKPDERLWSFDSGDEEKSLFIKITFLSPVRMKINNRYTHRITYLDMLRNILQRINIIGSMYGDGEKLKIDLKKMSEKEERNSLIWVEYDRYSARQGSEMKLGGAVGEVVLKGSFSKWEISLLKACEIFGLGKNTSFGFGEVKVEVL